MTNKRHVNAKLVNDTSKGGSMFIGILCLVGGLIVIRISAFAGTGLELRWQKPVSKLDKIGLRLGVLSTFAGLGIIIVHLVL